MNANILKDFLASFEHKPYFESQNDPQFFLENQRINKRYNNVLSLANKRCQPTRKQPRAIDTLMEELKNRQEIRQQLKRNSKDNGGKTNTIDSDTFSAPFSILETETQ